MIRSMTGFGKAEKICRSPECHITVEIVSVNRKQLELRWNLPRELSAMEADFRAVTTGKLSRGSVNGRVTADFQGEDGGDISINLPLLLKLTATAIAVRDEYKLDDKIDLAAMMQIPGVVESKRIDADSEELKKTALEVLSEALDNLVSMRENEGAELKADLERRIEQLKSLLAAIQPQVADIPTQIKAKLIEKLALEKIPVDMNDDRLLKEILFYADKSDTSEEITRLESHFKQFNHFLNSSEPAGRSLDFLLQEMFREITTLSNKAGTAGITPLTVAFKSELEKIREQVQNIE